jgi:hypothetical protein
MSKIFGLGFRTMNLKAASLVSLLREQELANPTIKEAFAKVIENGATRVIISPYFLSPGRHWDKVNAYIYIFS